MNPIQEQAITKWDNVYHLFNMKVEEASPEYSRVNMPIEPRACNGMGFVHGGVLFALGYIAFGAASNFGQPTGTVTLSSNVQFLSPGKDGPLIAEASCIRSGKHIVVYNVDIHDAKGVHVLHGTYEGFRTDFAFTETKDEKSGE